MALTASSKRIRRGPISNNSFGYAVAASEKVFEGGAVGLNSSGYLVRAQTSGLVGICGLASATLDNSGSSNASTTYVQVEKGTWRLPVTNATAANINAPVYASADDTFVLTPSITAAAGGTNTGNGTAGTLSTSAGAQEGVYTATFTTATAFGVTGPSGASIGTGTAGTQFTAGGVSLKITAGGTAFVAGDAFTFTVGANRLGELVGIEGGNTYVRVRGS